MFRQARQLPRLDLAAHHVQSLLLSLVTDWDDDLADEFGWGDVVAELFGLGGDEDLPLVVSYRRHKVKYVITLLGSPAGVDEDRLAITVRYATVPADLPAAASIFPNESGRESDLLGQLLHVDLVEPIQAAVEFEFGPLPEANLWYPLPHRLGEPPASPLFELRGVRGAKLDAAGERDEFAFTLDRTDDNNVALFVEFPIGQQFELRAPERALETASAIAREMIRLEKGAS